jgi:hypothetical protein
VTPPTLRGHLHASHSLFLWFCLLHAIATRGQSFRLPPIDATSLSAPPAFVHAAVGNVDFDADGRIDLRYVHDTLTADGERAYVDPAPGVWIVSGSRRTFSVSPPFHTYTEPNPAAPGFAVDPVAAVAAASHLTRYDLPWFRFHDSTMGAWGSSFDTGRTNLYLGVVFTAVDGLHAAWVRYSRPTAAGEWALTDSAWEPTPGKVLAVGAAPTVLVSDIIRHAEYHPMPPIATDGRDLTLGVRSWTNTATGDFGFQVDVRGYDNWLWWADGPAATNVAIAAKKRQVLPVSTSLGGYQVTNWTGLIVYGESVSSAGATNRFGPLADANDVYVAFTTTNNYSGWARVGKGPWAILDLSLNSSGVGLPDLSYLHGNMSEATPFDLDGDGLIDLETVVTTHMDAAFDNFTYLFLNTLDDAGILHPDAPFLPLGATNLIGSDTAGFVATNLNYFTHFNNNSFFFDSGVITNSGYAGFRFQAVDGWHYGWVRFVFPPVGGPGVGEIQFNPWPDQPIVVGAPPPSPLVISEDSGPNPGPAITWPVLAGGALEQYLPDSDRVWKPVVLAEPHRFRPDSANSAALYRLVGP